MTQFTSALYLLGPIAAAPDSSVWVMAAGDALGRPDWILHFTTSGQVAQFRAGNQDWLGLSGITVGPDGNVWFTQLSPALIGRMTPSGALTEFPLVEGSGPNSIITGGDGNLWFGEGDRAAIASMTTTGALTEYRVAPLGSSVFPRSVVQGSDGTFWFIEFRNVLGKISPGAGPSRVILPDHSFPVSLAVGPDGNVWFTDGQQNAVGRVDHAGAVREFALPRHRSGLGQIVASRDGHLWFADGDRLASMGTMVPEADFGQRVLSFISASSQTLTVTNTGNGPMAIQSVAIKGIDSTAFSEHADRCSGRSLAPGASCSIDVAYMGTGGSGLQSAFLEFSDNGTGSHQRVSLVAQLPRCELPVMLWNQSDPGAPQKAFLDTITGQVVIDPGAGFGAASATRTSAQHPGLPGNGSGYYDRAASRWLPVNGPEQVSPDGKRYAFAVGTESANAQVHVIDVATGTDRAYPSTAGYQQVVGYTTQGVYVLKSYDATGLWLLNPDSGRFRHVLSSGVVEAVDSSAAWMAVYRKAPDQPSQPAQFSHDGNNANEIDRVDLTTGSTTPWFNGGHGVVVRAIVDGSPVIGAESLVSARNWFVAAPGQTREMTFPFSIDDAQSFSGFVAGPMGIWVGGLEGVYLWSVRTGAVLVSAGTATPAGTCG